MTVTHKDGPDGTSRDQTGQGQRWTPEEWQRINAKFLEAIPLPPVERRELLSRVEDPEERRAIERLLELADQPGLPSQAPGVPRPSDQLTAGDRLGSYEILRLLGRGGMGVVYLGRDPNLERFVAIKLLSPELDHSSRQRERLRNEARSTAAISHAGIAHVYAFEEYEGGAYIVSEYVDGHTLRDEIANGPLPPAQAVSTAVQIARAVGAAHDLKIVHRDLKPENVMRTATGDVKVLDFGLALSLEAVTRLTGTGTLLGTLGYMSPEQLQGGEASPKSDIFALGLVLHELLAGVHAFAGPHPVSFLTRVLDYPPNPLPPQLRATLPGLGAVVQRCLEKRPERRYASMHDVAAALAPFETMTSVANAPGSGSGQARASGPITGAGGLWWWQMHQVVISLFYGLMLLPLWLVRPVFTSAERGELHAGLFVVAVAAMAMATSVRLNLAFTARVHPWQLMRTRARANLLVRVSDWVMSLSLLVAAGVVFTAGRPELAALLGGLAVFVIVAFLVIEPGTALEAFPEDDERLDR